MIGRKALGTSVLPQPLRDVYVWVNRNVGVLDRAERALPNFLVVGAQRSGTTSLFIYLLNHELVFGPRRAKGVHYFDTNYHRSVAWYRSNFPRQSHLDALERRFGRKPAVGEGAPYYLFSPVIPQRIQSMMPSCRIVIVLREPLERAVSHHHHEVKRGFETLSLTAAFDAETDRLTGELDRIVSDPYYVSVPHIHHAYLGRGQYADQVERYLELFGREQVLVLDSVALRSRPEQTLREATEFLGLEPMADVEFPLYNKNERDRVTPELRERYGPVFTTSNERLRELVPGRLSWL